jgi:hypothetical protein
VKQVVLVSYSKSDDEGANMKNGTRAGAVLLLSCLTAVGLAYNFSPASSPLPLVDAAEAAEVSTVFAAQECAKCEGKCKTWIDKCKEGGQYGCYKAAACLCKCNLDAGGCGSSKKALEECYEENEKLARELGPPDPEK